MACVGRALGMADQNACRIPNALPLKVEPAAAPRPLMAKSGGMPGLMRKATGPRIVPVSGYSALKPSMSIDMQEYHHDIVLLPASATLCS
jgi:hypothetical protein